MGHRIIRDELHKDSFLGGDHLRRQIEAAQPGQRAVGLADLDEIKATIAARVLLDVKVRKRERHSIAQRRGDRPSAVAVVRVSVRKVGALDDAARAANLSVAN